MMWLLAGGVLLVVWGLVKVNGWYYLRRRDMTPEERRRDDDKDREFGQW